MANELINSPGFPESKDKIADINTIDSTIASPVATETAKTSPVTPQIVNKEEIKAKITETATSNLETPANKAFKDAAFTVAFGRGANEEDLGNVAGKTVGQVLEMLKLSDLAPNHGLTTPVVEDVSVTGDAPAAVVEEVKQKSALEKTQDLLTGFADQRTAAKTAAQEEFGVKAKSQAIATANQVVNDAMTSLANLGVEQIREQLAIPEGIEGQGRGIPLGIVNAQINEKLQDLSVDQKLDAMIMQNNLNNSLVDVQIAQGNFDRAQELVQDSADTLFENFQFQLDSLELQGKIEADEKASLEAQGKLDRDLALQGYVHIKNPADLEGIREEELFRDPVSGNVYKKPEGGVDTLEALNIQAKQLDIAKKIKDLSADPTIAPATITQIDKIGSSFDASPIVKTFNEVQNKKQSIADIVASGVGGPADLALVFEFMKSLDPTSVVRESEYDVAAKSGNPFKQLAMRMGGYVDAGQFIPEEVKQEFKKLSGFKFDTIRKQYTNLRNEKARLIDRKTGDVDGSDYLIQYDFDTEQPQNFNDYYNSLSTEEADSVDDLQTEMNISDDDMWDFIQEEQGFSQVGDDTNKVSSYVSNIGEITAFGSPLWEHGLDVDLKIGDPVSTPITGEIVKVGKNGGFGNQVQVKGKDGNIIWLSHLDSFNVKKGDKIRAGDLIAKGGNTGKTIPGKGGDGSHLDITIKKPDGTFMTAVEVNNYLA